MEVISQIEIMIKKEAAENNLSVEVNKILEYMTEEIRPYDFKPYEEPEVAYFDLSDEEDPDCKGIKIYIRNRDWSFDLNGECTGSGGWLI